MHSDSSATSQLFGLPVRRETITEAVSAIDALVSQRGRAIHVVLNAGKVSKMASDPEFRELMRRFDMIHADGASIVAASRLFGQPLPERVAGIDLMDRLLALASQRGYKPFFLGAKSDVVELAVRAYESRFPSLRFAGWLDGYWKEGDPDDEARVVNAVRESGADMLFVAVPTPKKERFLARHRENLGVPFAMGVGGAFDVVAGLVKRAPEGWQKAGLEWLYRVIQEPRRMWKRYLVTNTHFLWLVSRELMRPRPRA